MLVVRRYAPEALLEFRSWYQYRIQMSKLGFIKGYPLQLFLDLGDNQAIRENMMFL